MDAGLDPDLTFHFDANPDLDPPSPPPVSVYCREPKYICQKKFPTKIKILESQLHQAFSPARDGLTRRPKQPRARGR
jgi:hypothetical protein